MSDDVYMYDGARIQLTREDDNLSSRGQLFRRGQIVLALRRRGDSARSHDRS